ncbi:hypothetical protein AZI86_16035 [Bdellovibrio bacteriovorus]|uniref:Uncharacterized protein n=1 Tax=Bdellovibrio bacteriovorus TaxID=959 RepID=A0A150WHM1_BDEBC|nr:DUF5985 family protein [Bdellovibrio bacteriovorus]KYG63211.1 hypothetical protein AZI86_16035 [Bdellovibrio bacteriovorus]
MAFYVYLLCSVTSLGCAVMLMRAYFSSRTRLLFWSSFCFIGIALNNILLSIDFSLGPNYDLSSIRAVAALLGMGVMMYGLIWDTV